MSASSCPMHGPIPILQVGDRVLWHRIQAPAFDGYVLSDTGNAERFEIRHGEDFRFVPAWKEWLVYKEGTLVRDEAKVHAREATRVLLREMRQSEDPKMAIWAVKSEKRSGRKNMLAL